jgi:hypothetical protein
VLKKLSFLQRQVLKELSFLRWQVLNELSFFFSRRQVLNALLHAVGCTVWQQNLQSLTSQNWLIQNALLDRLFLQIVARRLVALSPNKLLLNMKTPALELAHFNPPIHQTI